MSLLDKQVLALETKRVLALETSTEHLVLGWLGEDPKESTYHLGRAHAEAVTAHLETFLHGLPKPDLIAIGAGPGSYTGVRVAASLGLGLGRAWGVEVVQVSTLAAIAARESGLVAVSLNALRGNVYCALYQDQTVLLEVAKRSRAEFLRLIPDGAVHLDDLPPSGLGLARLALGGQQSQVLYL
jgi:tRNA threonylcarbamoyladenosine biosynthesis protein TsaB